MGNKTSKWNNSKEEPIIGYECGHVGDFEHNEMKEVAVGRDRDLIIIGRYRRNFFAFGRICPSGCGDAPLIEGAFRNGTVRCPWHGACFSAKTGDIEDFPGHDNIPVFHVHRHETGRLSIDVHPNELKTRKVVPELCTISSRVNLHDYVNDFCLLPNLKTFVIIGAGAAGFTCAVTLRRNQFQGRIVIITSDWFLPYDRTRITKDLEARWEDIKLESEEFYDTYNIEIMRSTTVEKVDFNNRKLKLLNDMRPVFYSSLLIATGMQPRVYDIKGFGLKNVFTINSLKDTLRLRNRSSGKVVIISGSSFIAMELASSLDKVAKKVTVISRARWPYGIVLGEAVGMCLLHHLVMKSKNVCYETNDDVQSIVGNTKGECRRILTLKGRSLNCDVFVLAAGGVPNTEFLDGSDLQTLPTDRTIPISSYMRTAVNGVFAAGDVVTFPSSSSVTGYASIAHWPVACKHGQVAALNMLGIKTSVQRTVPFYWTELCGVTIQYCGNGQHYNEVLIFGNPEEMRFCALYRRNSVILAVLTANCDPIAAEMAYDLEHHISYKLNEYPPYVTDQFPDPPFFGEGYIWWRYKDEKNVATFDAKKIKSLPVEDFESISSVSTDLEIDKDNLRYDTRPSKSSKPFS